MNGLGSYYRSQLLYGEWVNSVVNSTGGGARLAECVCFVGVSTGRVNIRVLWFVMLTDKGGDRNSREGAQGGEWSTHTVKVRTLFAKRWALESKRTGKRRQRRV